MSNQPHALSRTEWEEIGAIEAIREMWGMEEGEGFADFAKENIYGVKFDFFSGSPGYVGPLYILQSDTLTGDPPLMLTRDAFGALAIHTIE